MDPWFGTDETGQRVGKTSVQMLVHETRRTAMISVAENRRRKTLYFHASGLAFRPSLHDGNTGNMKLRWWQPPGRRLDARDMALVKLGLDTEVHQFDWIHSIRNVKAVAMGPGHARVRRPGNVPRRVQGGQGGRCWGGREGRRGDPVGLRDRPRIQNARGPRVCGCARGGSAGCAAKDRLGLREREDSHDNLQRGPLPPHLHQISGDAAPHQRHRADDPQESRRHQEGKQTIPEA